MHRMFVCLLVLVLLFASSMGTAGAEGAGEGETYKELLQSVDSSIVCLRHGGSPSRDLSRARGFYEKLVGLYREENFDNRPELVELHNEVTRAFGSLEQPEENIRVLRSKISSMASELGIELSPIYAHALFFILGLAVFISLLITLLNKRVVNWERVRQLKAEVEAFRKELRDAQRKRDMKQIHKLQLEQRRILSLQGEMMRENFKPMFLYIVPYFIFWFLLARVYSGWVVAWLPFAFPTPLGLWASCGFLSWYLTTYFGFSEIWRKLLIRG